MWTQLNVWVMRGSDACLVDNSIDWTVFTTDAHGRPFGWKGIAYSQGLRLSQPGHLAVEIPPGAYIVWAESGSAVRTHKAVVHVGFEPRADVLLLPDIRPDHPVPEPHECDIAIASVVGVGSPTPDPVKVTGTATGCDEVDVTVTAGGAGGSATVRVAVDATGHWTAEVSHIPGIGCGKPATVRAACTKDPGCDDLKTVDRLECAPKPTPG
ncbi:MAG TPA: hypothetical protein VFU43_09325 [Streptosporangiaceae bacterium]|nr:hypothetical protein [Streptosporangiaceae bacterium]